MHCTYRQAGTYGEIEAHVHAQNVLYTNISYDTVVKWPWLLNKCVEKH